MDAPTEFQLRLATESDMPRVAALVNSAYRGDSSRVGWTTEADLVGGQRTDDGVLRGLIQDPREIVLLYGDHMVLVGCVHLHRMADRVHLGMLTVDPERQANGLGRAMLTVSERWIAKNWGLEMIEITVIQRRSELIAWYERRGYRDTGERKPFPYGDEKFGLPKVEGLEFVVMRKSIQAEIGK